MSLDPYVKRFLTLIAAGGPTNLAAASVEQRRSALADLMKFGGRAVSVGKVADSSVVGPAGNIALRTYTPVDPPAVVPGLVYFHGGGLVAGSIDTHDGFARALARASRCRVISVDYRLAPEHPFPAPLEDALAAVRHIAANPADFGLDGTRLGVCGDSAGAALAAATCHTLARTGGPSLTLQLLLCPILDYSDSMDPWRDFTTGDLLDRTTLDHDRRHYLPVGVNPSNASVSPLRAMDFSGLPPTLIHTAECDPLRADGRRYYERIRNAGGGATYRCHPGMIHLFYGLGGVIPYVAPAMEQIGHQIRSVWEIR